MLVMECASNGSLLNYLKQRARGNALDASPVNKYGADSSGSDVMQDKQLMMFAWQIAQGMEHMANMKVRMQRDKSNQHRLLWPRNTPT